MINFDQETTRTLITAAFGFLSTGVVALFGWLSLTKREKLEAVITENQKIKRELISVYRQFSDLYQCENLLLDKLQELEAGKVPTLKKEFRKIVATQYERKITLTADRCSTRIDEIKNELIMNTPSSKIPENS